jgi:hypothetical protein
MRYFKIVAPDGAKDVNYEWDKTQPNRIGKIMPKDHIFEILEKTPKLVILEANGILKECDKDGRIFGDKYPKLNKEFADADIDFDTRQEAKNKVMKDNLSVFEEAAKPKK